MDAEALLREHERLRAELTRLERERAVEQAELRTAVARADAAEAALHHVRSQIGGRALARRALAKARRIGRRAVRRMPGR